MQTFYAYPFLNTEWDSVSLEIWENAVFTGDSSWYYPHMTSPFNRLYFIMEGEIYLENEKERNILRSGHMTLCLQAPAILTAVQTEYISFMYILIQNFFPVSTFSESLTPFFLFLLRNVCLTRFFQK